jgi:hypothetical protein
MSEGAAHICEKFLYAPWGQDQCRLPVGHETPCVFTEHDCADCGTLHGTCKQCGTTHGDPHSSNCPHVQLPAVAEVTPPIKCHDWQPIPRWSGRYKCSVCMAVGYRGMVTFDHDVPMAEQVAGQAKTVRRCSTIWPYICKSKGCKAPAVGFGKYQFCRGHTS